MNNPNKNFEILSKVIRRRRAIFPDTYKDQNIDHKVIEQILENANWAPTHKRTEPWRFRIFTGKSLEGLSNYLSEYYKQQTPPKEFSTFKYEKTRKKPLQCSHVLAICMQRDPKEQIPEWEEVAAVSCAVMNMWLSCTALGIGCYWSTPKAALEAKDFLKLKEGERCLGLFYMGYPKPNLEIRGERKDIQDKIVWM